MSTIVHDIKADNRSYRNIDKVDFIEDYINDSLAGRKQNTKENMFRLLRKNFPGFPPKPMVDFTHAFVQDILDNLAKDADKDLMNNKSIWVRDTKIYNIASLILDKEVEILTYEGPFNWKFLKRYFYKLYMTFYNEISNK
jgi:hypothetical protein